MRGWLGETHAGEGSRMDKNVQRAQSADGQLCPLAFSLDGGGWPVGVLTGSLDLIVTSR
jgi:hypothetical protein